MTVYRPSVTTEPRTMLKWTRSVSGVRPARDDASATAAPVTLNAHANPTNLSLIRSQEDANPGHFNPPETLSIGHRRHR